MPLQTRINLEPLPGKIIVEPDTGERETGAGIILLGHGRSSQGKVVAVYTEFENPDDEILTEPFIKLDDWVIFGQHSGVELTVDRKKYIVLSEREVLCRVAHSNPSEVEAL